MDSVWKILISMWLFLKTAWLLMFEPPWKHVTKPDWPSSSTQPDRNTHWLIWVAGWAWTISGLVLGALVAPLALNYTGLANSIYAAPAVIGIAVLVGFVVQMVGWGVTLLMLYLIYAVALTSNKLGINVKNPAPAIVAVLVSVVILAVLLAPLLGVGYGIHTYLNLVGAGQRSVAIAFVGAFLAKTFLIPFIQSIVTGALFRWFMRWLRGGKAEKA